MALNVNIVGRDSEGNLRALKVNSEGNLEISDKDFATESTLSIIKDNQGRLYGKYGEEWLPIPVDSTGRLLLASDVTVNAEGLTVDLGQIKQGPAGTEPWPVQLSGTSVAMPVDIQYHDLVEPLPVNITKRGVDSIVYCDNLDPSSLEREIAYLPLLTTNLEQALQHPLAQVHNTGCMKLFVNNATDQEISFQIITAVGLGDARYGIGETVTKIPAGTKRYYTADDFPVFSTPFTRLVVNLYKKASVTKGGVFIIAEVAR